VASSPVKFRGDRFGRCDGLHPSFWYFGPSGLGSQEAALRVQACPPKHSGVEPSDNVLVTSPRGAKYG